MSRGTKQVQAPFAFGMLNQVTLCFTPLLILLCCCLLMYIIPFLVTGQLLRVLNKDMGHISKISFVAGSQGHFLVALVQNRDNIMYHHEGNNSNTCRLCKQKDCCRAIRMWDVDSGEEKEQEQFCNLKSFSVSHDDLSAAEFSADGTIIHILICNAIPYTCLIYISIVHHVTV